EQIIGFAQEADDLLFGKTLLHVQSPWGRELDSKLRCYSKLGGRRLDNRTSDTSPGRRAGEYALGCSKKLAKPFGD
ncbi:hypothetical protein, partial [Xanthomonas citri]|uniref:hypothetical protein n=1 Tax=Xanthomonas citri TaxID=346 RepID=UPI001CA51A32